MIIIVKQTASNIKQTYLIDGDGLVFDGTTGRFSRYGDIVMSNADTLIRGRFAFSPPVNYIPLRRLFLLPALSYAFHLFCNDRPYGSMAFQRQSFLRRCYLLTHENTNLKAYSRSKGAFHYVAIYHNDQQIALMETHLSVVNLNYTHKLYLLDDYAHHAPFLAFFALYYASKNFTRRFHMSRGSQTVRAWSFSRHNHLVDPAFRETHFPEENFFGKHLP